MRERERESEEKRIEKRRSERDLGRRTDERDTKIMNDHSEYRRLGRKKKRQKELKRMHIWLSFSESQTLTQPQAQDIAVMCILSSPRFSLTCECVCVCVSGGVCVSVWVCVYTETVTFGNVNLLRTSVIT